MECVSLSEMKKELKENGYKNVDELPVYKIIELWQNI